MNGAAYGFKSNVPILVYLKRIGLEPVQLKIKRIIQKGSYKKIPIISNKKYVKLDSI
jgi:hypothetical protein